MGFSPIQSVGNPYELLPRQNFGSAFYCPGYFSDQPHKYISVLDFGIFYYWVNRIKQSGISGILGTLVGVGLIFFSLGSRYFTANDRILNFDIDWEEI